MHPPTTLRAPAEGRTIAVIPARWGSTRFPGKPLVDLDGTPMIVRVARRAAAAARVSQVLVATDDARIAEAVERAGLRPIMTPSACPTGTDRVARALELAHLAGAFDLVLNVQGDEPLIDPADLDHLVEATFAAGTELGTLARPITSKADLCSPHVVKVVTALDGRALYFSRSAIPGSPAHAADPSSPAHASAAVEADAPYLALQHVGTYAYRPDALLRLAALPETPLERAERLEQLRALEHGLAIHVARCRSPRPTVAVDVPGDVARVLELIRSEVLRDPSTSPPRPQ